MLFFMIKNIFEKSTIIQKIQLYLLVPMLLWLGVFFIEKMMFDGLDSNANDNNRIFSIEKEKLEKATPKNIVRFLEDKIELYKISLQTINIRQKLIYLEVSGSLENYFLFLQKLQTHLEIVKFTLSQDTKGIPFKIVINSEYFFNKKLLNKEFTMSHSTSSPKIPKIKIDAIVDDEVMIEDQWYKKGTSFNLYTITEVDKNRVILKDLQSKQVFTIELRDESL